LNLHLHEETDQKVRFAPREYGMTYVQLCVLDIDDFELRRDFATAIVCLYDLLVIDVPKTLHKRRPRTVHSPIIVGTPSLAMS
jgi:hypothetical protein